jgi:hypothetical protein
LREKTGSHLGARAYAPHGRLGADSARSVSGGNAMADLAIGSERRRAMRVPVRGVAVFYAEDGALHGRIENLSESGALVSVRGGVSAAESFDGRDPRPTSSTAEWRCGLIDVELKLGVDTGWVSAHAVRVERPPIDPRYRVAVAFERLDDGVRTAIETAIASAMRAAQRRPILVVDDRGARRHELVARLTARGMTPLAPRTPLEAIDLLARTQLHVDVCLLAPSFGHSSAELRALFSHSFPWVRATEISDDLDATVERAVEAWSGTDVARLSAAIA